MVIPKVVKLAVKMVVLLVSEMVVTLADSSVS